MTRKRKMLLKAQSGADLKAWRLAVGLRIDEIAELIGVSTRSVGRAEKSDRPSGKVLYGMELLQDKLLHGELDISPILQRRKPRKRRKKKA